MAFYDLVNDPFQLMDRSTDDRFAGARLSLQAAQLDWEKRTNDQLLPFCRQKELDRVTGMPLPKQLVKPKASAKPLSSDEEETVVTTESEE